MPRCRLRQQAYPAARDADNIPRWRKIYCSPHGVFAFPYYTLPSVLYCFERLFYYTAKTHVCQTENFTAALQRSATLTLKNLKIFSKPLTPEKFLEKVTGLLLRAALFCYPYFVLTDLTVDHLEYTFTLFPLSFTVL